MQDAASTHLASMQPPPCLPRESCPAAAHAHLKALHPRPHSHSRKRCLLGVPLDCPPEEGNLPTSGRGGQGQGVVGVVQSLCASG